MFRKIIKIFDAFDYKEKRKQIFLLSFLLPFVMLLLIIIVRGVYPFGDKCILRTDFYHQYLPFYSELQHKLSHFKSLFYTYDVGLGTNFLTLFAYYLSCPFNIFLFFIPQKFVLEFMTFMIIFKISLSSLTMSYYLVKRYKEDSLIFVSFSILYAFSGYMAAYYWNIMWLDNILLFPLLMLGFENVCNGKKPYLYIVSLSLTILCNYYIATITSFFFILYFIFYNIVKDYKLHRIATNFMRVAIYTIVSVFISSVLLLPVFYAFNTTVSSESVFPTQVHEYFHIAKIIGRHLPLAKVENGIEYWPNIYSGIITLPLLFLYFQSKKIKLKEKISYGILILFFIASFSVNVLDYAWHVFKFPNSLPCRQSFIYTFILLTICVKPLLNIRKFGEKQIAYTISSFVLFIAVFEELILSDKVEASAIYMSIVLLLIYLLVFVKFRKRKYIKAIMPIVLLCIICIESFINLYNTSIYVIDRNSYIENVDDIKKVLSDVRKITNDFYRVERVKLKAKDDGAFINFPSSSIFSSSSYRSGSDFYKQFGMEASTNAYSITGSTPFMDAFFSVKYKIYEKKPEYADELNIREINNVNDVYLYQNIDTLPISFILDDKFLDEYDKSPGNPATVQNNFARSMNLDLLLDKVEVDIRGIEARCKIDESGDYYAFVRDKSIKEVTVSYNNTSEQFKNVNRGFFLELGYLKQGDSIELRNDTSDDDLLVEIFKFNYESMKKIISEIKSYSHLKMKSFSDSKMSYTIDVKKKGTCVITLPYDDGFTIKVDGNKVDYKETMDFLLGFELDRGTHVVELNYTPRGLKEGLVLSFVGILALIAIICKNEYIDKRKRA